MEIARLFRCPDYALHWLDLMAEMTLSLQVDLVLSDTASTSEA